VEIGLCPHLRIYPRTVASLLYILNLFQCFECYVHTITFLIISKYCIIEDNLAVFCRNL
jgi:hypothetical protein